MAKQVFITGKPEYKVSHCDSDNTPMVASNGEILKDAPTIAENLVVRTVIDTYVDKGEYFSSYAGYVNSAKWNNNDPGTVLLDSVKVSQSTYGDSETITFTYNIKAGGHGESRLDRGTYEIVDGVRTYGDSGETENVLLKPLNGSGEFIPPSSTSFSTCGPFKRYSEVDFNSVGLPY